MNQNKHATWPLLVILWRPTWLRYYFLVVLNDHVFFYCVVILFRVNFWLKFNHRKNIKTPCFVVVLRCSQNVSDLPIMMLDLHDFLHPILPFQFYLFYNNTCWSCSIFGEWDDIAFCWLASYFLHSKIQIFAFNYSNCSHNSIVSCLTFFAYDSIFCKCPYNSMTCSSMALAFSFATCECVWSFISNPNPYFSMTSIKHHWGYLGPQLVSIGSGMMNIKEVESMKSTLHQNVS